MTLRKTQAAVAPISVASRPHLTVIRALPRERTSLFEDFITLAFGHLHGGDFSSAVHDVLDMRVRHVFLTERANALSPSSQVPWLRLRSLPFPSCRRTHANYVAVGSASTASFSVRITVLENSM
ncbi:MAG: hypothetical protein V8R08_08710 [Coriobacteriales bacterium]